MLKNKSTIDDTKQRCGAIDPNTKRACVLPPGHDNQIGKAPGTMHYAGTGFHWKGGEKAKAAKATPSKAKPVEPAKPEVARCPSLNPKAKQQRCTQALDHVGVHSSGAAMWKGKVPKDAPVVAERCTASRNGVWHAPAQCELTTGHDGDHEATVIVDDDWPETGQTRRIAWDVHGNGKGNEVLAEAPVGLAESETEIRVHPAADVLPMIEGPEFDALVEDIRANGQRHPVVLDHTGEWLVDGRNSRRACEVLGVEPRVERLPEGANVAAYVISTNLKRRHLNESQRAMIVEEIANLEQGRPKTGPRAGLTQAEAAAQAGVGERTVRRAAAVREKAVPELVAAVKSGKVDLKGAEEVAKLPAKKQRELLKERVDTSKGPVRGGKLVALAKQEEKRATVRRINSGFVAPMPAGPFGVIYGDYPWLFDNSDQHEGSRGHTAYPGMPMEDVLAHAREAATRAGKDCVLALWFVDAFLHEIGNVLSAYGATMRRSIVWDKSTKNDKDKAGVGTWCRPRHELLILASIGNPVHTLNEVETLIRAPVREPGRKPDIFAELLLKHCAGPFVELFAREHREGFVPWGAEVDKFATEAA